VASAEPIALESAPSGARLPWIFRLTLASPGAPWLLAAGLALLHLVAAGVVSYVAAPPADRVAFVIGMTLLYSLYFGCVPVVVHMLRRGAERDLAALAAVVGIDARGLADACDELLSVTPRAMRRALAFGVGIAVVTLASMLSLSGQGVLDVAPWAFLIPREVLIDALLWTALGWGVAVSVRMARLFGERAEFSLLDSTAFVPVVRSGMRVAVWWLVLFALSVTVLPGFAKDQTLLEVFVTILAIGSALAIPVLYLPLAVLRRRIRADKQREIADVHRQIHDARAARDDAQLPGLLAWEARIASVAEWPIDAGALRRLGLYLLIPLGSWVGGALVERVVDSALR
jgi:hypothetical protein